MKLKDFANMIFSAPGGDVKIGVSKHFSEQYLGDFNDGDPDDFEITSTFKLENVLKPEYADAEVKTFSPVGKNYIRVQVMDPVEES